MTDSNTPINQLSGIGPKVVQKLTRLGLKTVGDFFTHFPHRYEDFSKIKDINSLVVDEKTTISGRITEVGTSRTFKRIMSVTEALVEDKTGTIRATWFNQPYLTQTLKKDLWVNFSGKVALDNHGLYFSNPIWEVIGKNKKDTVHTGALIPVYPETRGLTSRWLRFKIKSLLATTDKFEDFLPDFLTRQYKLKNRDWALRRIHFPKNERDINDARRRLAFDELFLLQLVCAQERKKMTLRSAPAIPFNLPNTKKLVSSLPFTLTKSQRLAAWQILQDMERPHPMNRLLEGDVGSGKTVVALIAALGAVKNGYQVAFLAPTEILAQQHFKTLSKLLESFDCEVALLTSSVTQLRYHGKVSKKVLAEQISSGEVSVVIGTHAIIQKNVVFPKLALVVVDEQHRFGVEQRAALLKGQGGFVPHLLSMTATPIPRTLALTLYGDLDISLLKEMPKGRKKIITKVVSPANRQKAYGFIESQIKSGRQAFVICPLIEDSEKLEVRSVQQEYEKLGTKVFPRLSIDMLHGRLKAKEKDDIMQGFKVGSTNILVSTAVVEVGIDVPNAAVMMIEGSERFGLAQLHQFRGRVGRAEHQSYCFLFTDSPATTTHARLKALVDSEDGFALAEKDLKIRGPGEFFGQKQSGLPDLAMASLKDVKLIEETQQAVKYFLSKSAPEKHPALATKLKEFKTTVHWE